MSAILYPIFTLCHLGLLGWALWLYQQSHESGLIILIAIITAITYDNLIVSLGRWIGEGRTLLWLSHPRFIGHVLLTPLSVVAAFSLCAQGGLQWAANPIAQITIWSMTWLLITAEVLTYYKKFTPTPLLAQSTLRYTNSAYKCLPVASIVTTIAVGIVGAIIWRQLGYPWLLLSSIVMFIGGAIPQSLVGGVVCSGVEVVLISGFCMTANQIQAHGHI
jgi:hypothetical protein